MATYKIYSLRDVRTEAYMRPVFAQNDAVMARSIVDGMNDPDSMLAKHPQDYALYYLGEFHDNMGVIEAQEPVHMYNIVDLKEE